MRKLITICIFLASVCYAQGFTTQSQSRISNDTGLALVGARIYLSPTENSIANGVVLISKGKITAVGQKGKVKIPPRHRVIDCTGQTLTSGFWNSHVHFIEPKWKSSSTMSVSKLSRQLKEMLTKYGFTTVFDTGSVWEETLSIRRRIEAGEVNGPRILTVGEILSVKDGLTPALMSRLGFLPNMIVRKTV
jgi:imidazolonepropionase-like amidohydrolase